MVKGSAVEGPFFLPVSPSVNEDKYDYNNELNAFGWLGLSTTEIPNWHKSLINDQVHPMYQAHWTNIPDFIHGIGDIKAVWELSRFDWVIIFTLNYLGSGEKFWLDKLNQWLENWSLNNPANIGPNWKCGQEASIRVIHLAIASQLLKQSKNPTEPFKKLIRDHMERIAPTIGYAVAQNNNHGTSEASALFIGGSILYNVDKCKKAKKWYQNGRYWLENRVEQIIEQDGSFSQYSVNYHRLMLDTMTTVEMWRVWYSSPEFSDSFYNKIHSAIHWLRSMIMSEHGYTPNLGANDGAKIIPLQNIEYSDYRSSVQLAAAVFLGKRAFKDKGKYDQVCDILGINYNGEMQNLQSQVFNSGGYVILRNKNVNMLLRYPIFRFRPSHCDALHLDLWIDGNNVLRDSGTYSYNTNEKWQKYFPGTASHNTIQFDDRDQMPRISRFLFSNWLISSSDVVIKRGKNNEQQFEVGYKDYLGASHLRKVKLLASKLFVVDEISGFNEKAIIRWRLMPGKWMKTESGIELGDISLVIKSSTKIKRIELVRGWESLFYFKKTSIPVLEVEVDSASIVTTTIAW